MSKTKRVIVLPDTHVPNEDPLTMRAVVRYMKDHKWDEVIQLGDFLDLNCISSHNKENLRSVAGQTLFKDAAAGNRVLDTLQQAAPGAQFTITEGNHCFRAERYIDANPQMEGLAEVPNLLQLEARGINWVPYWSEGTVYTVGKASFGHGIYHSKYHARTHVEAYGCNFFYGHLHTFDAATKVFQGENNTLIAQSLGCLCSYRQKYLRGRPTSWQQGFAVFHFRENGMFNYFPVMVFDNAFTSPEGGWYDGKKK